MRLLLPLLLLTACPKPVDPTPPAAPTPLTEDEREIWAGNGGEIVLQLSAAGNTQLLGRLLVTTPTPANPLTLPPILQANLQRGDEVWQWGATSWPTTFEIRAGDAGSLTVSSSSWVTHDVFPVNASTVSFSPDADDATYEIKRVVGGAPSVVGWLWVARTPTTIDQIRWYKKVNTPGNLFVVDPNAFLVFAPIPAGTAPTQAHPILQTVK